MKRRLVAVLVALALVSLAPVSSAFAEGATGELICEIGCIPGELNGGGFVAGIKLVFLPSGIIGPEREQAAPVSIQGNFILITNPASIIGPE